MRAPLIVVTGTGTGIGKTHLAEALLRRWGGTGRVCGLKPIETGVAPGTEGEDARRLREASTFHVKRFPVFAFAPPVSPHLAAREAGAAISVPRIVTAVDDLRAQAEGVLVELPGGLFSPLGRACANADLARALGATSILLCAPDRIGVLHDIGAATRAARATSLGITGIVLSRPDVADESTDRNAAEITYVTDVPLLASFPRAPATDLAALPATATTLAALTR